MLTVIFTIPQIALGGRYSRDYFNRYGDLRHIRRLRFWPLNKVLLEKSEFSEQDASELTEFLVPEYLTYIATWGLSLNWSCYGIMLNVVVLHHFGSLLVF